MSEAPDERVPEPTVVTRAFSPGSFFGDRFRIERMLGMGGMGSVYEATDLSTDRRVALKVLKRASALTEEMAERFRREADILHAAKHAGIVGIHDFGRAPDGTAWLAMELLVGETLRTRVNRDGGMRPEALVPILSAAAEALTQAHARGVVHRDLKPDHLFLPADGSTPVKLLDFGLSLSAGNKKLTTTGMVIGTPRYMSPEQIASAHASDGQSDVYALGVIMYEALTGQSPFAASDHGQLLGAILQGRTEPLSKVRPDLGPELEAVIAQAMAKETVDRWKTPAEFARAFSAAALGHGAAGAPVEFPPSRPRFSATPVLGARARKASGGGRLPDGATPRPSQRLPPWWLIAISFVAGASLAGLGAFIAYTLMR